MTAILFVSPYQKQLGNLTVMLQKRKPSVVVRIAATGKRADVLCTETRFDAIFMTPFSITKLDSTLDAIRNIRSLQGTEAKIYVTAHDANIYEDVKNAGCTGVIPKRTFNTYLREFLSRLP